MIRSTVAALVVTSALVGVSQAQSIFGGGPRYDGTVKIVELIGTSCPPGQEGQVFNAVYRAKVRPRQIAEAMSVAIPTLAGAIFLVAEGDGTFRGADQIASGTFILDAWRDGLPDNTEFNLNFDPNVIEETTPSFTFRGTVQNYFFPGCTARTRGNFVKR
jgi:hypothetical protein